jgi:hypothetical protein
LTDKQKPAEKAALIAWIAFLFVLMILSRIEDRRRRRRFAPSLTRSSTRANQYPSDQGRHPIMGSIDPSGELPMHGELRKMSP